MSEDWNWIFDSQTLPSTVSVAGQRPERREFVVADTVRCESQRHREKRRRPTAGVSEIKTFAATCTSPESLRSRGLLQSSSSLPLTLYHDSRSQLLAAFNTTTNYSQWMLAGRPRRSTTGPEASHPKGAPLPKVCKSAERILKSPKGLPIGPYSTLQWPSYSTMISAICKYYTTSPSCFSTSNGYFAPYSPPVHAMISLYTFGHTLS